MTLNGMKIKLPGAKKNQKLIGTDGIRRTLDESTLADIGIVNMIRHTSRIYKDG